MSDVTLHLADCVEWARNYSGPKFHALLCDPPYHLTSIVRNERSVNNSNRGQTVSPFGTQSKGFMGKQWDGGDLAFDPATWAAFGNVLHDGAFGMAFASSRGWHRLAVAIEDAGFIIHPSMFGWSFGSGFPKATRVDTQIQPKAEQEQIGFDKSKWRDASNYQGNKYSEMSAAAYETKATITKPTHPLAQAFAGHRYGLQALKPALEPIIVFQKPYRGRPIDCIVATGAGVLNVDGSRIGVDDNEPNIRNNESRNAARGIWGNGNEIGRGATLQQGRWPSNFYLADPEAARRLDEQSGNFSWKLGSTEFDDTGGASRFFFTVREQLDAADPVRYCAKASRRERDAGLEGMALVERGQKYGLDAGGDLPQQTPHKHEPQRNSHPTVKPLSLCKYLATLLLPPAEYAPRRLFVPFAGVASEVIGAMQAGWDEIEGVEITEEYMPIAQARVDYWKSRPKQLELV